MLKRIVSIALCLVLTLSLVACSDKGDDKTNGTTQPTQSVENTTSPSDTNNETTVPVVTEPSEDPTEPATEPTKPQPEPFDYYLIPLHKETVEKDKKTYTNLWLVFQLTQVEEFFIMPSDFGYDIKDTSTGENLMETAKVEFFSGSACTEPHSVKPNRNIPDSSCIQQTVILISSEKDISFENLEIVATPYIKSNAQKDRIQSLEFKGDMSALDLKHELIHGRTIFAIDGKYYINDDSYGISWGDSKAGICGDFICINGGTAEDFLNSTNGKVSLAYGEAASSVYQPDGYTDELYLKPMGGIPTGCELWYEVEDDIDSDLPVHIVSINIGVKSTDGSKFKEDGIEEKTGFSAALCFTHEDGTITVFSDR